MVVTILALEKEHPWARFQIVSAVTLPHLGDLIHFRSGGGGGGGGGAIRPLSITSHKLTRTKPKFVL